jgi:hypothetical protein
MMINPIIYLHPQSVKQLVRQSLWTVAPCTVGVGTVVCVTGVGGGSRQLSLIAPSSRSLASRSANDDSSVTAGLSGLRVGCERPRRAAAAASF